VSFEVSADAYLRFMGQYSEPLAVQFADLAGIRPAQAGLDRVEYATLTVRVRDASFEQWWERFTLGAGPAGAYVASLTPDRRAELRARCRRLLPDGPVEISATAWAATYRT
jgi:hypothetical protein